MDKPSREKPLGQTSGLCLPKGKMRTPDRTNSPSSTSLSRKLRWIGRIYAAMESVAILAHRLCFRKEHYDLLLVKTEFIGDSILWLDAAEEYARLFQNKKSLLLCSEPFVDLIPPGLFTKVVSLQAHKISHKNSYYLKRILSLRKYSFELAINNDSARIFSSDSILRVVHASQKIAFAKNEHNFYNSHYADYDPYYSRLIELSRPCFTVYRYQFLIRQCFSSSYVAKLPKIKTFSPPPFSCPAPYFVFFVGCNSPLRSWDEENFIQLIDRLPQELSVVLAGSGAHDRSLCQRFAAHFSASRSVIEAVDRLRLSQLATLVSQAQFSLGNDSMGCHLSAAVETHTFCVSGGGLWHHCVPYPEELLLADPYFHLIYQERSCFSCAWQCRYPLQKGVAPCLAELTPDEVYAELQKTFPHLLQS